MKKAAGSASRFISNGFTLVELLVAMTVLVLIVTLTFTAMSHLSSLWQRSRSDIDAFQDARTSFERITRNLSQATLNPYWDYQRDASGLPVRYLRRSDLQFISGAAADTTLSNSVTHGILFQAPVGRVETTTLPRSSDLLCVLGYYVAFQSDQGVPPAWVSAQPGRKDKSRFRLFEVEQSAENFHVYGTTNVQPTWLTNTVARPIADNCIALILSPRLADSDDRTGTSLAPNYSYNSRKNASQNPQPNTANQLPPAVLVTMIAISEKSAIRLSGGDSAPEQLKTKIATALSGRFQTVDSYAADLKAVTDTLSGSGIDYHVFSSLVPIQESKWSQ